MSPDFFTLRPHAAPVPGFFRGCDNGAVAIRNWLRRLSPREAVCLFPWSVAASAGLVAAVVVAQRWLQAPRQGAGFLLQWAAWAAGSAMASWLALRFSRASLVPSRWDGDSWKSYLLALQGGVLALCVPAYLYVWRTPWEAIDWDGDFLNKRWLLALYWMAIGTLLAGPHVIARVLGKPEAAAPLLSPPTTRRGFRTTAIKLFAAGLLAWYIYGPPWNLERNHREIEYHEQVHLGPLQAIEKGYLPYVGPASSQYGPGSQLLTYAVMKWSGHFDLLGYRAAGAWIQLLTAFGICAAAALFLEGWMLIPLFLLALAYSPLGFFYYLPNGALDGFFGWANGFRYLGATIFLGGLPLALERGRGAAIGLGAALGAFCYLAQENLSTAIAGGGLFLLLVWLTATQPALRLARALAWIACGFGAVWMPVLIFYAAHGQLGAFLRRYLLFGAGVAHGFLNSWWLSPHDNPQYRAYLYTGALLIAIGIFILFDSRARRLRFALEARQTRLLAFVCAGAAAYSVSLFRSDSWHQRNTTVALPFVLLLAFRDLPRWTVRAGWPRWVLRGAIAAAALWIYPLIGSFAADAYGNLVAAPIRRLRPAPQPTAVAPDPRVPFQRVTQYWSDEPLICAESIPMRPFLDEMTALHQIAGARKTMVVSFPGVYPALIPFLADLTPAPQFLPKEMIMADLRQEALDDLKAHLDQYECIVTDNLDDAETRAFRERYPAARVMRRAIGNDPYYVVLKP